MDNSPPHSLIMVVVGVMEVRDNPSHVLEGQVHRDHYLHSLVNNRDSLVGHVVVFISKGLSTRKWWTDFG